jgi:hypothetical protein
MAMQKFREFGFPIVLVVLWMVAAAYTLSLMIDVRRGGVAAPEPPPAEASTSPAS